MNEPIPFTPAARLAAIDGLQEHDAEEWLVGSLLDFTTEALLSPAETMALQGEMLTTVPAAAFGSEARKVIWTIGREIWRAGQLVTPSTVWLLAQHLGLDQSASLFPGGLEYLQRIMFNHPSTQGWQYYAGRVLEAHQRRSTMQLLQAAEQQIVDVQQEPGDVITRHIAALAGMNADRDGRRLRSMAAIVASDEDRFTYRLNNPMAYGGLVTGLDSVDFMTDGFRPGEIVIVAALTSGGKSIFALQTAMRLAAGVGGQQPVPVFYLSAEMIGESLKDRAVFAFAGIDPRQGKRQRAWRPDQRASIEDAVDAVAELPLHIEDGSGGDWYGIQAQIDLAVARFGIGFVVVDHLHLCHIRGWKGNRTEELNTIMSSIKTLATKHNLPVMALAQLNRGENGGGQFVDMNRIKGSGDIEQDADVVIFLDRPAQGKKPPPTACVHEPWRDGQLRYCNADLHDLKVHFTKVRNGQVGTRNLWIDLPTSRITELEGAR